MNTLVLLLGGNHSKTPTLFKQVEMEINQWLGTITQSSSIYQSSAWGFHSDHPFLNQVLIVETQKGAENSLYKLLELETKLGRIRESNSGYSDRAIDIDILYFNQDVIKSAQLEVPHPRIQDRRFALLPLMEVLPNYVHPIYRLTHKTLLSLCPDRSNVKKI